MLQKLRNSKGFTLIELMIVVAIIAILAVVAVPQFSKYMRSAKAAEANEMLDLIKKGSATYYTTPRSEAGTGKKFECQFPTTVANVTPNGTSCCDTALDADGDDRCDSSSGAWNNATWSALKFAVTDQHYFQYLYESTGTQKTATFTASAFGDLDCDTTKSTFQMVVHGDPKATDAECDQVGSAAIFRDNETE
ncbi:MAG: prepilin-type N-terminal cleavage/methylation domain-containing protein [Myxococcales bacterium]|nr:prepilin-type N-terminal cleavage/methylation domain-containing protein [Myxococcales bacterium]